MTTPGVNGTVMSEKTARLIEGSQAADAGLPIHGERSVSNKHRVMLEP